MKRSGPPRRRKSLAADPAKRRAFVERNRQPLARSKLKPGRRRRDTTPEGPLKPREWEAAVYQLDRERCIVTRRRVTHPRPSNFHHVIPKQTLRGNGLHHVVYDPDNGVTVEDDVHANHEAASHRIPRERLPQRVIEFARRHGFTDYIESTYPATGHSRDPSTGGT